MALRVGIPLGGDREEDPKHIAKPVIDLWLADAIGQMPSGIGHVIAQIGPDRGQLGAVKGRLNLHLNPRQAWLVDRGDPVNLAHALNGGFQRFGDLGHDLLGRGAGILGDHNSGFDCEGRVFQSAKR